MFSTEQQNAANGISRAFLEKKLRYAILKSQCQAGKTGAYQSLINLMLREGTIQRAYILCGSHELELRSQAIEDAKKHNPAAFERGLIQVLFRQDFASAAINVTNALVIVDESHLDQTKGQQLDMFLARHGLSMDGNPTTLNEKNAFIVSVDATPYSELAALEHKETPYAKHVEELIPGSEYVGIDRYLYSGLLKSTFDISREPHRFASLFKKGEKKYALLRLSAGRKVNRNAQEVAVEKLARTLGWRVLYYTAAQTDVAITKSEQKAIKEEQGRDVSCLEVAPEVPTLIIIRGRLRAGKVVPKKHIAFVWEGAKSSKTDALVQGLAGRMCGYRQDVAAEEDPMKLDGYGELPLLFVPESALERHEKKVVKSSEIERAILVPHVLPTKATNLKKPRVAAEASRKGVKVTQCPPIRLTQPLDSDDWNFTDKFEEKYRSGADRMDILQRCLDLLKKNLSAIKDSPNLSSEQKKEILGKIIPRGTGVSSLRNLHDDSQMSYFKELFDAYENGTVPSENIDDCPEMTFVVTYAGYKAPHSSPKYIYVVFYTKASAGAKWVENAHLKSRVPETNGRSIFSFSVRATAVPLVAAGATGFSEANLKKPEDLEKALRDYLTHWRTSELTVSREIQSNSDRFALDKAKFHYLDTKSNDVQRICAKVGTEFGVKMNVKFARSSAGARGHFNVKSISW
jgi:hypothetical protein